MPGVQLPLALSSLRCRANAVAVSLLRHCHRWAWHRQHHPAPTGKRRGGCDSGGGGSNPSRDNPAQSTTQAAMDGAPPPTSPTGLSAYVAVSQLLGLTLLATTGAWLGRYRGGVAWHSPLQFNAHPLCMVLGMVFLQGDALLVYRVFRHEAKRSTKALHALLHGLALVIALVGIIAVFESHRTKGIPNMYSLHSWCGMATFVLYLLQWLLGCGFFLFPGASSVRGQYKPQHIFFGITLFILSITSCLLGITEMLLFKIRACILQQLSLGMSIKCPVPPPCVQVFAEPPRTLMSLRPLPSQLEDTEMAPAAHWGPHSPSTGGTGLWGTPGAISLWQGGYWAASSPSTGLCHQVHLLPPSVSPQSEQNTDIPLLL
ncbi:transmembrane ascorbate-dependent reductase CYB561 isoform X2 [Corvus kubaryi]|uniref:transmembrane ascorbate-dependent reductase CYB561 isoform X2 n=1 Tax=Corvus kubaryi TaxID=68294 RepID=UPI001C043390|nr:transmembrane ascorbate-dependent reductase CYB561 isoform X2 [Corvus kubaryi]